ncbi:unnamed protein product [Arctia plantaginis]|uniref:Neurotransmitter-gated ion-channel transmembrane domain-containing protein n=1 Tax=Arctia plantaginis TaxID=874455 RepID=A0A8S1BA65_ARCPL|nr:unnamed protein product [Arctia plantaginis]
MLLEVVRLQKETPIVNDLTELDLKKQFDEGDTTNYQTNGEFDLVSFDAIRHNQYYSCCVEPYPDITYIIKLRRRPMFYVFNLILPCLLINGIALLVFYVPSESGEKVTLGISALLSMTVFLMTIRDTLPPTEKTPLIIRITYGVARRGVRGQPVPNVLRELVLQRLARLLFINLDTDAPKGDGGALAAGAVQVNPRTGSRLKSEVRCDGIPMTPASPRFARHNHNHLGISANVGPTNTGSGGACGAGAETVCAGTCPKCACCGCTLREAAARHEQRVAANERLERANLEWKQVN